MIFADVKAITIPEGRVKKITIGDIILWQVIDKIPNEYQQVEYISAPANSGAYLKLGFTYDTSAIIRMGQSVIGTATTYVFGAAENSGQLRCMITANADAYTIYGSDNTRFISIQLSHATGVLNNITTTFKAGDWSAKNETNNSTAGPTSRLVEYSMTNELYLLGQNYNGTARFGGERRISYFQYIDKTGAMICDLVPCYRKSDGIIGMYDRARKIFLTNAGTDSFTCGEVIGGGGDEPSAYTNLVTSSLATPGGTEVYGDIGYKNGYRWSSSAGAENNSYNNARLTGWIPFKKGATLRIKNFGLNNTSGYVAGGYIVYYSSNGSIKTVTIGRQNSDYYSYVFGSEDYQYFRISGYWKDSNGADIGLPIVTLDEAITT